MRGMLERALHSRVGVRMMTLFFLCASVPLAGLAALTVSRTTSALEDRAWQRLQYESRLIGQDGLGRLDLLSRILDVLAKGVAGGASGPEERAALAAALLSALPEALVVLPDAGPALHVVGRLDVPALTAEQERHLDDWGRLITPDPRSPGGHVLIVATSAGGRTWRAATTIDPRWLFDLDREDARPQDSTLCLAAGPGALLCSAGAPREVAEEALRRADASALTIGPTDNPFFVRKWFVTLEGQYGAPAWSLALMRPRNVVRDPIAGLVRDFWLVAALAILTAAWIGLAQVRRLLRPLEVLTAATAALAQRRFDTRVDINSNDEFQTLGRAFDSLGVQLRQQFDDLEAFNLGALLALARAIDAKSSWTAGHSERVTDLAVSIAEQMSLPSREIDELRRGGLVHDVGKLATPAAILDKPGRLTPEEERIMRLHPTQGVHILEPVPAFGPLLPIVGQHHERWDGKGYPNGLSGEAISRTARVLAVADTYDALHSDRPYRPGMPVDRAIDIIAAGSGTQFDPSVVDAFVAIARHADRLTTTVPPLLRHETVSEVVASGR